VPKVAIPLSNDPAKQREALGRIAPTDTEGDMGEALRLAAALVSGLEGARILVLSDGCFPKVTDFSPGKASVVYKSIGSRQETLGIAKTPKGTEVYCGIKNFGLNRAETGIAIYADGKLIHAQKLQLASLKSAGVNCLAPANTKLLRAELDAKDLLQADNRLSTLVDPNAAMSVLLVSRGDPFLERALLLDPRVSLDRASALPLSEGNGKPSKYDLIIFDGVDEADVSSRATLTFGSGKGKIDQPSIDRVEDAALAKGVGLDALFVDSATRLQLPADAKVVAFAGSAPMIATLEGDRRRIYVAFEPMNSDFPLQVGFPIFVSNVLDFVAKDAPSQRMVINTGRSVGIRTSSKITLSSNQSENIQVETANGVATLSGLDRAGDYKLEYGGEQKDLTVNLRSDIESDIAVKPDLVLGSKSVKATQTPTRLQDLWRYLAVLALGFLAFEWWLYARKS
jgi:hypothetical protein